MARSIRAVTVALLAGLALAGCATYYPAQVQLDPAKYEDGSVRLEWAVGIDFFRLKVTNLTDQQLDLDLGGSAIVSVDGEARPLSLFTRSEAALLPPKSYIVHNGTHGAVFGTDILGRFNAETEVKYPLPANPQTDDRLFLKSHSGETVRLYISATVKGKKVVLDVPFKIAGATRVQSSASDAQQPATTAPAAKP